MAPGGIIPDRDDEDAPDQLPFLNLPGPANSTQPPCSTHSRGFRLYTLAIILSLVFWVDVAGSIEAAPTIRILESILCLDYYKRFDPSRVGNNGTVEEKYCKIDQVQELVAYLNGWDVFFVNLPGLFLAIPYGMAADNYGRKWFMVMGITSIFLRNLWTYTVYAFPQIFPIRLMWLEGVLTILGIFTLSSTLSSRSLHIGGGPTVTTAMFLVVMSDVTTDAERATVFFYAQSIIYATNLLGPPVSSLLMDRNPWLPMNIGLAVNALSVPIVLALPETVRVSKSSGNTSEDGVDLAHNSETPYADSPLSEPLPQPILPTFRKHRTPDARVDFSARLSLTMATLMSRTTTLLAGLLATSHFLVQDWRVSFLIVAASAHTIAETSAGILLQYVPKRYAWTISQTNYLYSLRAAISIVVLLVLLPEASKWLMKDKKRTSFSKDVLLCRVSFALVTTGVLIDGLAPVISVLMLGLFVHTLGSGTAALVRSLMAGLVKPTEVARLFTVMSLQEGSTEEDTALISLAED